VIRYFNTPWHDVPVVVLDTETTGVHPGNDRAVQVGIVRFERGVEVGAFCSLVNPERSIPVEATAVHGITDEMVTGAPSIREVFERDDVRALLSDAQPAAYNWYFDKPMVPIFTKPWDWPWLDPLGLVRFRDRWEKGVGRHRLETTCKRHGIELSRAHDSESDARAAGRLWFKLGAEMLVLPWTKTLGEVLATQARAASDEWFRYHRWLSTQPPLENR
jgi:DNA polymerase-3 subunit epsilon